MGEWRWEKRVLDYKQNFDLVDLICKLHTRARIHIIIMLNPSFLSAIKSAS